MQVADLEEAYRRLGKAGFRDRQGKPLDENRDYCLIITALFELTGHLQTPGGKIDTSPIGIMLENERRSGPGKELK